HHLLLDQDLVDRLVRASHAGAARRRAAETVVEAGLALAAQVVEVAARSLRALGRASDGEVVAGVVGQAADLASRLPREIGSGAGLRMIGRAAEADLAQVGAEAGLGPVAAVPSAEERTAGPGQGIEADRLPLDPGRDEAGRAADQVADPIAQ